MIYYYYYYLIINNKKAARVKRTMFLLLALDRRLPSDNPNIGSFAADILRLFETTADRRMRISLNR